MAEIRGQYSEIRPEIMSSQSEGLFMNRVESSWRSATRFTTNPWWKREKPRRRRRKPENYENTQIRLKCKYKYTQKDKKYTNTKIHIPQNTNFAIGTLSGSKEEKNLPN